MPFLPFIPFANCAEVVLQGTMGAQAAYLTFGFQNAGAWSGSQLQDLADAMAGWATAHLLPILHNSYEVDLVKATDLTTEFAPVAVSVAGLPQAGGVSGSASPNNVNMVVSFKTVNRGRSFRGRNYVPGVPPGNLQTTTTWTAAFAATMEGVYNDIFVDINPLGFTHVVLSRFNNSVRRTVGVATPVTQYLARVEIGTQRRRIIGHGI